MKSVFCAALLFSSLHAVAASPELRAAPIRTVDAVKLCKGYFKNDPEAVKAFNELKGTGAMDVATVCTECRPVESLIDLDPKP